jgi:hypothetical protein
LKKILTTAAASTTTPETRCGENESINDDDLELLSLSLALSLSLSLSPHVFFCARRNGGWERSAGLVTY